MGGVKTAHVLASLPSCLFLHLWPLSQIPSHRQVKAENTGWTEAGSFTQNIRRLAKWTSVLVEAPVGCSLRWEVRGQKTTQSPSTPSFIYVLTASRGGRSCDEIMWWLWDCGA